MTDVIEMLAAYKLDVSDEPVPQVEAVWRKLDDAAADQSDTRRSLRASGSWWRRGAMRWATVGGAAVAAAVALLVVGTTGSGPAKAFAGWSATPTVPASGQVQAAEAYCQRNPQLATLTPTLTDTRGPYTLLLYAENAAGICIAGPSMQIPSGGQPPTFSLGGVTGATTVAPGALLPSDSGERIAAPTGPGTSPAVAFSNATGRVGVNVTAVTLVLADGTNVQATVENGWYAAWWPGSQAAQTAEITTTTGTTTQALPAGANAPAPPSA